MTNGASFKSRLLDGLTDVVSYGLFACLLELFAGGLFIFFMFQVAHALERGTIVIVSFGILGIAIPTFVAAKTARHGGRHEQFRACAIYFVFSAIVLAIGSVWTDFSVAEVSVGIALRVVPVTLGYALNRKRWLW